MWWSADTDKGKMRDRNEDSYACEVVASTCIACVCDGVGGENGGEVASSIACEVVKKQLMNTFRSDISDEEAGRILYCAVNAANIAVYDEAKRFPDLKSMGTTMVAAVITPEKAHIASVGDSRAYILRDDFLTQLTEDHTRVQELYNMGKITKEEMKTHPQRHIITRALGAEETVTPDIFNVRLEEDDALLLCSDGLYNFVPENELAALTAVAVRKKEVSPLIMRANEMGGGDNITSVLVSLSKGGRL